MAMFCAQLPLKRMYPISGLIHLVLLIPQTFHFPARYPVSDTFVQPFQICKKGGDLNVKSLFLSSASLLSSGSPLLCTPSLPRYLYTTLAIAIAISLTASTLPALGLTYGIFAR